MTTSSSPKPWYREPWPWFLMAGPLLAMVGCIITIYLAVTRFDGQAIVEGAVKRGLVVERAVPAAADGSRPAAQP
ncbi:FixH family protein [Bordetella genomosp. 7]|uniref:Lipoprotein n=1 Tax=Bordetella genomosp. 7 TaxID=1416805 RepID=A0A261QYE2_9BORD|nr:FixH family protein [Bordetella genomosp. 7]OZI17741.1 lipoprotein [Bordetella genomosp. 7]